MLILYTLGGVLLGVLLGLGVGWLTHRPGSGCPQDSMWECRAMWIGCLMLGVLLGVALTLVGVENRKADLPKVGLFLI